MRCRACPKHFVPNKVNGLNSSRYCLSCLKKREREKKKKMVERAKLRAKKKREKKRDTNKYWGQKCWTIFAKKMKEKAKDFQGFVGCYTCLVRILAEDSQAGHCFHRGRGGWRKIDFDIRHIHIQCQRCNLLGGGSIPIFTANLIRDYGWEHYEYLKKGSVEPAMTVEELKELYKHLTE